MGTQQRTTDAGSSQPGEVPLTSSPHYQSSLCNDTQAGRSTASEIILWSSVTESAATRLSDIHRGVNVCKANPAFLGLGSQKAVLVVV